MTRSASLSATSVETRVRTSFLPPPSETPAVQQQRAADRRKVELFCFEHGRWPEGPEDGEPWEALQRETKRNLRHQLQTPAQPFEPDQGRWRRWSAARQLVRRERVRPLPASTAAARPRESRARRRSSGTRASPARPDEDPDPVGPGSTGGAA